MDELTKTELVTSIQLRMNTLTLASPTFANLIRQSYSREIAGEKNSIDLESFKTFLETIKIGFIVDVEDLKNKETN